MKKQIARLKMLFNFAFIHRLFQRKLRVMSYIDLTKGKLKR